MLIDEMDSIFLQHWLLQDLESNGMVAVLYVLESFTFL